MLEELSPAGDNSTLWTQSATYQFIVFAQFNSVGTAIANSSSENSRCIYN